MTTLQALTTILVAVTAAASAIAAVVGLSELGRLGRVRARLRRTVEVWEKMPPGTGRDAVQRVIDGEAHRFERVWGTRGRRTRRTFHRPATMWLVLGVGVVVLAGLDAFISSAEHRRDSPPFASLPLRQQVETVAILTGLAMAYLWSLFVAVGPVLNRFVDRMLARRNTVKRARRIARN